MFEEDMLRKLELALYNYNLTEYLKMLSDEDLDNCEYRIICDDIIGVRVDILGAIRLEKEYRMQDRLVAAKTM